MRFTALLRPGPAWIEGKTINEQDRDVVLAHLHSMRRRYDQGSVLFGGPFVTADGGVALLEAPGLPDAKRIMDQDPAISARIMEYALFEVRPYFDAIARKAWSPKI